MRYTQIFTTKKACYQRGREIHVLCSIFHGDLILVHVTAVADDLWKYQAQGTLHCSTALKSQVSCVLCLYKLRFWQTSTCQSKNVINNQRGLFERHFYKKDQRKHQWMRLVKNKDLPAVLIVKLCIATNRHI